VEPRDALWEALLDARERAVRVARARGARPDDVDDFVQEATARVAAMADVDVSRVAALLTVVVANLVVDRHRAALRTARLEQRLSAAVVGQAPPDEELCDAAEARWLRSRTAVLSDQDRRVLEMRIDGLSSAASAAALGVTRKAAQNALGRARAHMLEVWRATAALVSVLVGRRPARAGATTATAALAACVLLSGGPGMWRPDDGRGAGVPKTRSPRPVLLRMESESAPAAGPRPPAPVARRPARPSPAPPAPAADVIATGPVRVGPVRAGETVRREHRDESTTDTLQRCLRDGITISQSTIGCSE
jgi:RNA polymerase sigma factor (sigma-70 family)